MPLLHGDVFKNDSLAGPEFDSASLSLFRRVYFYFHDCEILLLDSLCDTVVLMVNLGESLCMILAKSLNTCGAMIWRNSDYILNFTCVSVTIR